MAVEQLTGMPIPGYAVSGFGVLQEIARRSVGLATGRAAISLDLDGTTVVAERTAMRNRLLELGSGQTLAAAETVELPASSGNPHAATKLYLLQDATSASAYAITAKVTGGSASLVLPRGAWVPVWANGTEISALRAAHAVRWYAAGTIGSSATLAEILIERDMVLPDGLPASLGYAGTAPTGGAGISIDLKKNGAAAFGTMDFANAAQTATFTMSGDEAFAAGDRLSVVAQSTVDGIANVAFTLHGLAL